eukprot:1343488-Pyramimonas_sp.AAC.1
MLHLRALVTYGDVTWPASMHDLWMFCFSPALIIGLLTVVHVVAFCLVPMTATASSSNVLHPVKRVGR